MSNCFHDCPLAIVGLGLRLPGADSLDTYWDMLLNGRHAIAELPASRLNRQRYFKPGPATPGKSYTELGGTVPDEDLRPESLGLSDEDLRSADIAHLWFLHVALMALRNGGIDLESLVGQRLGVYAGHARGSALVADLTYSASIESLAAALPQELAPLAREIVESTHARYPRLQDDGGPFTQPSSAAGLVARRLKTTGPYMAVNAACASSFAALDIAARAIHAGEIEAAIVGGCSYNQWSSLVLFSQVQALSATGSFPFDERADGFISSDGYAAIVVEPLSRARAAGRKPLSILRGIGGSCDGRGKSLWAPLKEGQIEAIKRAYGGDVRPRTVQVVEAHATGTAVGDATELAALAEVYLPDRDAAAQKLPISSAKANIGHTRETAGLAGLIKIVLAMQKGIVPPAASFSTPSSRIDWEALPFRVPRAAEPWPDRPGEPRRAAIDAFGIGGLNYHVVLDHDLELDRAPRAASPHIEVSAKAPFISDEPIAIVGAGVVLPGATDLVAFSRLLHSPPELTQPATERWEPELYFDPQGGPYRVSQKLGHFLRGWQFDWRKYKVPPKQVEHADPMQFMMIDVAAQALRRAGYGDTIPEHLRTTVYVGSIFGGDFTNRLNIGMRLPEFEEDLLAALLHAGATKEAAQRALDAARSSLAGRFSAEDQSGSFSSSTLASLVAKYFDFCGPCCAIDAEEASGLAALSASLTALRAGTCDLALCCAGQRLLHYTRFAIYERLGRLAVPGRRGFYLTEGAVAFALTRLRDAERQGQPILAVIKEVRGAASDIGAWSALRDAALSARERLGATFSPQRVECFATGVERDEADEREVIKQVYAQQSPQLVSATAQLGMGQGASGLIGLLHLMAGVTPTSGARTPAALNSIGLRGLAFHAILESGSLLPAEERLPSAPAVASAAPKEEATARIIRFGAPTLEALYKRIAGADLEVLFAAAAGPSRFAESDGWRLAIVASSAAALKSKLALLRDARQGREALELWPAQHEQGVFLHERPAAPPELAFAFSGQGSQYAGMLKELCTQPAYAAHTAPVLAEMNDVLTRLEQPRWDELVWNEALAERLGSDTWSTQIAVFGADMLMHAVLRAMGLSPSLYLAHSYGEYPALCASGAWTLRTGIEATFARSQALGSLGEPPGKLISAACAAEALAPHLARFDGRGFVAPANFNSPEQTVLAVESRLVDAVLTELFEKGIAAQLLPVRQPYHSKLLEPAQPGFSQALDKLPLRPPRTPFLSGVGNFYVADPHEIRQRLVRQLTAPLLFSDLIRRAYADGARVFIEVGPRTVLTRLVRTILKFEPVMALCCDHPKVAAREQLLRVQALLETQDLWPACAPKGEARGQGTAQSATATALPIPHFDATERRRSKLAARHAHEEAESAPRRAAASAEMADMAGNPLNDLERFLVSFVCEQTGYPPEVVGLDQDLEADLGIDSLKKAQMLGELRDQFKLKLPASAAGGGLSLAKIVTLRDVSRLLPAPKSGPEKSAAKEAAAQQPAAVAAAVVSMERGPAQPPISEAELLRQNSFSGSRYDIGKQHGAAYGAEIERSIRRYRDLLGGNVLERAEVKAVLQNHQQFFDEAGLAELAGIAASSGLPYDSIVAYNLGLEPEHGLFGCSQLAVRAADNAGGGLIHAANEDSPIALRLSNQLLRFVQVRHLECGPNEPRRNACAIFSSPGQLGGINGLNAAELAVSSTMLLDQKRDLLARGALHPCLVLRILEQASSIDEAIEIVRGWRRVGAWSLLLSHAPTDRIAYLEYDGERLAIEQDRDCVCTSNHSQLLPAGEPPEHSQHRLTRLATLLEQRPIAVPELQSMLRDRLDLGRGRVVAHRTMNTVCRVDNQLSFVFTGRDARLLVTPGPERGEQADHFCELSLKKLFRSPIATRPPERLMRRFILRTEAEAATAKAAAPPRNLPTLIVGGGETHEVIARAFKDAGCEVRSAKTAAEALRELDFAPQRLVLLTALEGQLQFADPQATERQRFLQQHGRDVFLLVQRFVVALRKAGRLEGAEVAALTAMGGDLGFGGARELRPEGGALSGLLKALRREIPELRVKLVDTPQGEPPALLVRSLLAELASFDVLEVGYVRGRRQRVRMIPRELDAATSGELIKSALHPDAAWLVTGGGRGITAAAARELGRRFGVRLHLLGRSPRGEVPAAWLTLDDAGRKRLRQEVLAEARKAGRSPQEAWQEVERRIELHTTLDGLRDAEVDFHYHAVDLADAAALSRVLAEVRAGGRPLTGILHGAGVEHAAELSKKSEAGIAATLGSKVLGLQHLLALTAEDPIAAIVGFGSVSGRFGGLGQTDYSLASDLLAKLLAAHRRRTGVRATTFAWPAWSELGMAARPESRLALEAAGHLFMPVDEGIEHLLRELAADLPESEVVLIDRPSVLDADHTALAEEEAAAIEAADRAIVDAAILDGVIAERGQLLIAESRFDPRREVFLLEHQFEGAPILPAVIALESMAEAALLGCAAQTPFALEEVAILTGMRFYSQRAIAAQVQVESAPGEARTGVKLFADSFAKSGVLSEPSRLHVSGFVSTRKLGESLWRSTPPAGAEWQEMRYLDGPVSTDPQEARRVYHGPTLRTLRRLCRAGAAEEAFGELVAPPLCGLRPERPAAHWRLPAALLDGCLVACGAYSRLRLGLLSLPGGFARLTVLSLPAPNRTCWLALRLVEKSERNLFFDFVLTDENDRTLLWAAGYRAIVLAPSAEREAGE